MAVRGDLPTHPERATHVRERLTPDQVEKQLPTEICGENVLGAGGLFEPRRTN
jgi:hypothetical protein